MLVWRHVGVETCTLHTFPHSAILNLPQVRDMAFMGQLDSIMLAWPPKDAHKISSEDPLMSLKSSCAEHSSDIRG